MSENQQAQTRTLSVIIPVYNAAQHIPDTLHRLFLALDKARLDDFEIVVVNDGSTDDLLSVLDNLAQPRLRIINQVNQGRLYARRAGLMAAKFNYALLIDSRIQISPDALFNVLQSSSSFGHEVISGPCRFPENSSLLELFWDSVTRIVWFRYHKRPKRLRLTESNFGQLPKGTTCMLVPVDVMLKATNECLEQSDIADDLLNDDTAILRKIARKIPYWIDPDLDAIYQPRATFRGFWHHAFHRGKVFVHGFLSNWSKAKMIVLLLALIASLLLAIAMVIHSLTQAILVLFTIALACTAVARFLGLPWRNIASLVLYVFPFAVTYGAGLLVGLTRTVAGK